MVEPTNILRGEKVRLTAVEKTDLPAFVRWHEDATYTRLLNADPAMPRAEGELGRWLEERQKDKDAFLFAVRTLAADALLGFVEIDGVLWAHQHAWLALGLGERETWGKGYGREALELGLRFAFDELNLHRVQLTVFSYNERAIALYRATGFRHEGTFREHLQRDGRRHDMLLFGLLRHEWAAR
jgi:RimJ/RimL family protein N-acetyltransferase